ncbi:ribonuclease J [Patescibacteria group bacterium]
MTKRNRKKHGQGQQIQGGEALKIIPLGGQEEVGRNMTIFEYGKDIVIIDMGLQFPEEDMPGVDYIIPNISYLRGKEKNIRGVVFSHGHLDHIGAAPILLEKLGNPMIIGRPLTLALIKNRAEDYKKGSAKHLKIITVKSVQNSYRLGRFNIRFFPVDHSIMDAMGVILETPKGTVIHPGDWTYERDPIVRSPLSYHSLSKLPKPTFLMLESLGSVEKKERVPERVMHQNLNRLIREAPGRVIIGTFSSQVERIKLILEYASKIGKKVALDGYSMKVNVKVAMELGYIKVKQDLLITVDKVNKYPDNRVVVICTGAQGESNAVLSRIINGNHRFIKIKKPDTIIFSSSVIPGNERSIQRLKDNLYRLSDNVIHSDIVDVHSGGHSDPMDIVEVVKQVKPTYFLPVYANHFFHKEAEKLVVRHGFPKDNIFILDNGSILEHNQGKPRILPKKVPSDYVFVDGLGIGDVSNVVLRDRQQLADEGMFVIIVNIDDETGNIVGEPDIISRGFVYMKHSKQLVDQVKKKVKNILKDQEPRAKADKRYITNKIRDQIGQFLFTKTQRRPMVMPVVIEV